MSFIEELQASKQQRCQRLAAGKGYKVRVATWFNNDPLTARPLRFGLDTVRDILAMCRDEIAKAGGILEYEWSYDCLWFTLPKNVPQPINTKDPRFLMHYDGWHQWPVEIREVSEGKDDFIDLNILLSAGTLSEQRAMVKVMGMAV